MSLTNPKGTAKFKTSANVIAYKLSCIVELIMGDNINVKLPPGFRFSPTDEELVVHFLQRKASLLPCHPDIIPDLHLYPYDPWDLDGKAMAEGNKWYFYSRITNETRITGNGYWKPVGVDEAILSSSNHKVIGTKKYYAFYMGDELPQGHKTNWLMQEFRLSHSSASASSSSRLSSRRSRTHSTNEYSKWVICRVHESNSDNDDNDSAELSCLDEVFLSLDDLDDDNISLSH